MYVQFDSMVGLCLALLFNVYWQYFSFFVGCVTQLFIDNDTGVCIEKGTLSLRYRHWRILYIAVRHVGIAALYCTYIIYSFVFFSSPEGPCRACSPATAHSLSSAPTPVTAGTRSWLSPRPDRRAPLVRRSHQPRRDDSSSTIHLLHSCSC